jgi:hypothetical protein
LLSSCGNNFLARTPISQVSEADYFKTLDQIKGALIAVYEQLDVLAPEFVTLSIFKSDNFRFSSKIGHSYSFNDYSRNPSPLWANLYKLIYRSNLVIDKSKNVKFNNETKKKQYVGEARFLRGFAYFWLVRTFGKVPIVTKILTREEAVKVPRSPVTKVYDQIEKDLKFANNSLPENSEIGRVNKYVAEAMLAKVYIMESGYPVKRNKYKDAIPLLEDVIKSGKYKFDKNYADIFTLKGQSGSEILWSVVMSPSSKGPHHSPQFMIDTHGLRGGTQPFLSPEVAPGENPKLGDLWLSFKSGDIRKYVSLDSVGVNSTGDTLHLIANAKYRYGYVRGIGYTSDYILMRYANVLLLYAEALNHTNHASIIGNKWDIINRIRNRAGLPDVSTRTNFENTLLKEKRHEFVWENTRWFDLLRTNTFVKALKRVGHSNTNKNWRYVAIPENQIEIMKEIWSQNPGF